MYFLVIFGIILCGWWLNSFWITYLDYKHCRIDGFWLILGQIINVLTCIFVLRTIIWPNVPITSFLLALGFLLIIWFSHYAWVDYSAEESALWLRLIYGTVDVSTCLYICLIIYKNIFLIADISEKFGKESVILALEKILKFGQTLVI